MKSWTIAALLSFLVIFFATVLAYLSLIPREIKSIPHYDSIGHFFLFGIFAFTLDRFLKSRKVKVFGLLLPMGSVIVASYAMIDESLQLFSTVRTFDLGDLSFGLLGIAAFYIAGSGIAHWKAIDIP